jgi:hypothetical protein
LLNELPLLAVIVNGSDLTVIGTPERVASSVTMPSELSVPTLTLGAALKLTMRLGVKVGWPATNWNVAPLGVALATLQRMVSAVEPVEFIVSGWSKVMVLEPLCKVGILAPVLSAVPLELKTWQLERFAAVPLFPAVRVIGIEEIATVPDVGALSVIVVILAPLVPAAGVVVTEFEVTATRLEGTL